MFLFFFINFFIIKVVLSLFFSFFLSFFITNFLLFFFKKYEIFQIIRKNNSNKYFKNYKIPSMGGISIFLNFIFLSFIFVNWLDIHILILILFFILNFFIGFIDDFIKIYFKNCDGLSIFQKFFLQSLSIIFFIYFIVINNLYFNKNNFLVEKNNFYLYYLLWYFLLFGGINAINFTDGLDGLVILPILFVFLFLFLVSLFSSNVYMSKILGINYIYYAKELCIISSIMFGSCLSFFFFNFYPAQIFLGDTGSLSIGSLLISMFILLHKELYFIIVGFLFVIEFFSVFLQVIFFKLFKKRIFLMTPIHHHYELSNCSEIKIVSSFWIISLISFFISIILFLSSL